MAETSKVTAETLEEAERYLRQKGVPEDGWVLNSGQLFYRVSEVEGKLFGLNGDAIRTLASSGQVPNAVQPSQQVGWRLPRSGIIFYIAQVRRAQEQRQVG